MKFTSIIVSLLAIPAALASALPRNLVSRDTIVDNKTYKITNGKATGIVVDLSAGDNTSIIGYPDHDGDNQKWIFAQSKGAWTIKSAAMDLYIAPNTTTPGNYSALQAIDTPFLWDIWHDEVNSNTYRFFVNNTALNWDLAGYGNPTPGNTVQLFQKYTPGWTWQTWTVTSA
ncbi:carbohydrate-binding module family 13 protein [Athelia psychrophila]|uniref:Carbohydrate-binding module family 13 protein n=1 Tax=Athelia psychrophila TaxID=1759441 RepID=A0A166BKE4_9AGAM|nr:carbohydrate-binding module family 13 protein [Fibularhizoctonia sp. CBS 109695]KZP21119.1 carbohydrate-binding module family 13 protein [Fibularhizoctonia sp. CBS 109695]